MQGGRKLEARATPAAVRFPLHHAALQGDIERVRFLIGDGDAARRGMEMRADDEDDLGRTALHVAAAFGHVEICALFCGLDAAIVHKRAELMQGVYPLHLACAGGWEGDTFLSDDVFFDEHGLGDKGAAASGDSKSIAAGDAEMTEAQKKRLEVVMLLLENGADATARTSTGSSALHLTAGTGDLGCARKLIEYGADINCRDVAGRTPLYSAASNGQRRMIAFLLNARADASIATTSGESVLHAAALCSSTHPDTIDWLVSAGASMQGRKSDGKTPLMLASESVCKHPHSVSTQTMDPLVGTISQLIPTRCAYRLTVHAPIFLQNSCWKPLWPA